MRFGSYFLLKKDLPILTEKQVSVLTNDQQINNDFIVLSNEQSNEVDEIYNDFLKIIEYIYEFEKLQRSLPRLKRRKNKTKNKTKNETEYKKIIEEYNKIIEEYNQMEESFKSVGEKYLVNNDINDNILFIFAFRRLVYNNLSEAKLLLIYLIKQTTPANYFKDILVEIRSSNSEEIADWFFDLIWFKH